MSRAALRDLVFALAWAHDFARLFFLVEFCERLAGKRDTAAHVCLLLKHAERAGCFD